MDLRRRYKGRKRPPTRKTGAAATAAPGAASADGAPRAQAGDTADLTESSVNAGQWYAGMGGGLSEGAGEEDGGDEEGGSDDDAGDDGDSDGEMDVEAALAHEREQGSGAGAALAGAQETQPQPRYPQPQQQKQEQQVGEAAALEGAPALSSTYGIQYQAPRAAVERARARGSTGYQGGTRGAPMKGGKGDGVSEPTAPAGVTPLSSIDRVGADPDVIDVCLDALAAQTAAVTAGLEALLGASSAPALPPPPPPRVSAPILTGRSVGSAAIAAAPITAPRGAAPGTTAASVPPQSGTAGPAPTSVSFSDATKRASSQLERSAGTRYGPRGRPLCTGHRMEAVLRRVKKKGPNKGRYFYACPCAREISCEYFAWKDADARRAVAQFLAAAELAALAEATAAAAAAVAAAAAEASPGAVSGSVIVGPPGGDAPSAASGAPAAGAAATATVTPSAAARPSPLSPSELHALACERRVRESSVRRWMDRAYGVKDLKRECERRGIRHAPASVVDAAAGLAAAATGKRELKPRARKPDAAAGAAKTRKRAKPATARPASSRAAKRPRTAFSEGAAGGDVSTGDAVADAVECDEEMVSLHDDDGDDEDAGGKEETEVGKVKHASSGNAGKIVESDDSSDTENGGDSGEDDDDDGVGAGARVAALLGGRDQTPSDRSDSDGSDSSSGSSGDSGTDDDQEDESVASSSSDSSAAATSGGDDDDGDDEQDVVVPTRRSERGAAAARSGGAGGASKDSNDDDFAFSGNESSSDSSDSSYGGDGKGARGTKRLVNRRAKASGASRPPSGATRPAACSADAGAELSDTEDEDAGFARRKKGRRAAPARKPKAPRAPAPRRGRRPAIAGSVDDDDDGEGKGVPAAPVEPVVSVSSLRRHELVAVLVHDDVQEYKRQRQAQAARREAAARGEALPASEASAGAAGAPGAARVAGRKQGAAAAKQRAARGRKAAGGKGGAPDEGDAAMSEDSADSGPGSGGDEDKGSARARERAGASYFRRVGRVIRYTLRTTFGYREFRGASLPVLRDTLGVLEQVSDAADSSSAASVSAAAPADGTGANGAGPPLDLPLQEWAVRRVLAGRSSLVVAATGTGKSLCYQLPALLLAQGLVPSPPDAASAAASSPGATLAAPEPPSGVVIVVSPLVALMRDQMLRLPRGLIGCCLSGKSAQGATDVSTALIDLRDRRAHVLFVSPERLFSRAFIRLARTPGVMPPVACVCVDEAHVLSEWSHNFRPAYLRLHTLIASVLRPRCVLALTATATPSVVEAVRVSLAIPRDGVWSSGWRRPNLSFSVSREADRSAALVALLRHMAAAGLPSWGGQGETSGGGDAKPAGAPPAAAPASGARKGAGGANATGAPLPPPTIVYVTSQSDAEAVANFCASGGLPAAAYHAGLGLGQRDRVYARFLSGSLRVVVATVAFGMGLDKPDIRCVVHYHAPRSVEDYVQQCGRAGRDGLPALCHAFVDAGGEDARRLHSLASSDVLDPSQVAGVLSLLVTGLGRVVALSRRHELPLCLDALEAEEAAAWDMDDGDGAGGGEGDDAHGGGGARIQLPSTELTLSLAAAQTHLNLRPEVTETLLCYLEHTHLAALSQARYGTLEITFTGGSTPAEVAKLSPVVATIVELLRQRQAADKAAAQRAKAPAGASATAAAAGIPLGLAGPATVIRKDPKTRTVIRIAVDDVVAALHREFARAAVEAVEAARALGELEEGYRLGEAAVAKGGDGAGADGISSPDGSSPSSATAAAMPGAEPPPPPPPLSTTSLSSAPPPAALVRLRARLSAAASRASALQPCLSHASVMRDLMTLQSAGRLLVAWSDWGLGVSVSRSSGLWSAAQAAVQASEADEALAASGVAAPPSSAAGAAGATLAPFVRHLTSRMNTASRLSITRLARVQRLLDGACLPAWWHAWGCDQAGRSSVAAPGGPSPFPPCDRRHISPVAACERILAEIDAYLDAPPDSSAGASSTEAAGAAANGEDAGDDDDDGGLAVAAQLRKALPPAPVTAADAAEAAAVSRRVPPSLLPSLVSDVHAAIARMKEVIAATLGGSQAQGGDWSGGGADAGAGAAGPGAGQLQHLVPVSVLLGTAPSSAAGPMDAFLTRAQPPKAQQQAQRRAAPPLLADHLRPLLNGASIARVLHGVYSPVFTAADFRPYNPEGGGRRRFWGGGRPEGLWGRYAGYDFDHVAETAGQVLQAMATGGAAARSASMRW